MSKTHSPRFEALVDDARGRITETDADAVHERIERGDDFVLVDVRERDEWDRGHLPGAIHLSKGVIERDAEQAIPDLGADVVLYCGGGYRSALAADNLRKMGYARVASMDGGWRAWTERGYATEA
ncbi:MAG: rhodanese-like domain-containing protein [Rhodothermales bacterium]|nr:rhodanese-like domain-containing protein [Rhodothermales bacterium]